MKNLINLCLFFFSVILVVGCGRKAVPYTTVENKTTVRDSIVFKEVPKLIEVPVPGEKVYITDYIECDSLTHKPKPKNIHAGDGRAMLEIRIDSDGKATATGGCDSAKVKLQILEKEIQRFREKSSEETITKTEPINYKTRRVDIFCRWFTGLFMFFLLLVLGKKIFG